MYICYTVIIFIWYRDVLNMMWYDMMLSCCYVIWYDAI